MTIISMQLLVDFYYNKYKVFLQE